MAVYEKDGGYTNKAFVLDCKVHKVLDDIVREAMKDGMEMEEVLYVVGVSAKTSALRYLMGKKLGKEL